MTARAAALVLVLAATAALAVAPTAAAVTRKQADRIAVRVLKPGKLDGRIVLFREPRRLARGTAVFEAGRGGSLKATKRIVPARLRRPAWMYWLDQAHGAHFEHPSTLLLVNARSGRTQRRKMMWLPLIARGRKLSRPAFLATRAAYLEMRNRVFRRIPKVSASRRAWLAFTPAFAAQAKPPITADDLKNDCMVTIGARSDPQAAGDFRAMEGWAEKMKLPFAPASSGADLVTQAKDLVDKGCRDVLIYISGHGTPPPGWEDDNGDEHAGGPTSVLVRKRVSVSFDARGRLVTTVRDEYVTPADVRAVAEAVSPRADLKVKVDACFAGRWREVRTIRGVALVELASGADEVSYFDIEHEQDKSTNPTHASEFTNGNVAGLDRWAADPRTAKRTLLEGLEASFDLGADQDFARAAGLTHPLRLVNAVPSNPPQEDPTATPTPTSTPEPVDADFSFYPQDNNEIDLRLMAGEAFDGFVVTLPGGRQVTNFLPSNEFPNCAPTQVMSPNDSLGCGGGAGLQPGGTSTVRIRSNPAPQSGMGGQIRIASGNSPARGPYPVGGP